MLLSGSARPSAPWPRHWLAHLLLAGLALLPHFTAAQNEVGAGRALRGLASSLKGVRRPCLSGSPETNHSEEVPLVAPLPRPGIDLPASLFNPQYRRMGVNTSELVVPQGATTLVNDTDRIVATPASMVDAFIRRHMKVNVGHDVNVWLPMEADNNFVAPMKVVPIALVPDQAPKANDTLISVDPEQVKKDLQQKWLDDCLKYTTTSTTLGLTPDQIAAARAARDAAAGIDRSAGPLSGQGPAARARALERAAAASSTSAPGVQGTTTAPAAAATTTTTATTAAAWQPAPVAVVAKPKATNVEKLPLVLMGIHPEAT